jgi:hypothetical protein
MGVESRPRVKLGGAVWKRHNACFHTLFAFQVELKREFIGFAQQVFEKYPFAFVCISPSP